MSYEPRASRMETEVLSPALRQALWLARGNGRELWAICLLHIPR